MKTTRQLEIEVLSPLHINSGHNDLKKDIDYLCHQGVHVMDIDRLLNNLSEENWGKAVKGVPLSEIITKNQYSHYALYILNSPVGNPNPSSIKECVKDSYYRPYIPGSSFKGAIRTGLAWAMLKDGLVKIDKRDIGYNPRYAGRTLMARLFGTDPNHDLLRAFSISDTEPLVPGTSMELNMVAIYNLTRQNSFQLKENRYRFAVEMIRPGTTFYGMVSIDDFLLGPDIAKRLGFDRNLEYLKKFIPYCNDFSKKLIEQEKNFFQEYKLNKVIQFYNKLANLVEGLGENECLLQISWGTGWNAKTLQSVLSPELMQLIRAQFRLGRRESNVFPKTRRLVERNNVPEEPLGWIKIKLYS